MIRDYEHELNNTKYLISSEHGFNQSETLSLPLGGTIREALGLVINFADPKNNMSAIRNFCTSDLSIVEVDFEDVSQRYIEQSTTTAHRTLASSTRLAKEKATNGGFVLMKKDDGSFSWISETNVTLTAKLDSITNAEEAVRSGIGSSPGMTIYEVPSKEMTRDLILQQVSDACSELKAKVPINTRTEYIPIGFFKLREIEVETVEMIIPKGKTDQANINRRIASLIDLVSSLYENPEVFIAELLVSGVSERIKANVERDFYENLSSYNLDLEPIVHPSIQTLGRLVVNGEENSKQKKRRHRLVPNIDNVHGNERSPKDLTKKIVRSIDGGLTPLLKVLDTRVESQQTDAFLPRLEVRALSTIDGKKTVLVANAVQDGTLQKTTAKIRINSVKKQSNFCIETDDGLETLELDEVDRIIFTEAEKLTLEGRQPRLKGREIIGSSRYAELKGKVFESEGVGHNAKSIFYAVLKAGEIFSQAELEASGIDTLTDTMVVLAVTDKNHSDPVKSRISGFSVNKF